MPDTFLDRLKSLIKPQAATAPVQPQRYMFQDFPHPAEMQKPMVPNGALQMAPVDRSMVGQRDFREEPHLRPVPIGPPTIEQQRSADAMAMNEIQMGQGRSPWETFAREGRDANSRFVQALDEREKRRQGMELASVPGRRGDGRED